MLAFGARRGLRRLSSYPRLVVEARAVGDEGSAASRRLRRSGRIPSVVYGVGPDGSRERQLVHVCERELWRELRQRRGTIENTLYELEVAGGGGGDSGGAPRTLVLPRQVQVRAASDDVMSVNFLRFTPGARVTIPLRYVDAPLNPLLKRGAYLHRVAHSLTVVCDTFDIPEYLDVSVAVGGKNHVFRAGEIAMPEGLRPASGAANRPLAVIKTK